MSTEGQRVIEFARKNKGHKVGNGECWTLAEEALKHAKAQTSTDIHGSLKGVDDYEWGDPITVGEAAPGDIIQFIKGYSYSKEMSNEDREKWDGGGEGPVALHHTAIVDEIVVPGVAFGVLHQNWKVEKQLRKKVFRSEFHFRKHRYTDTEGYTVRVTVNGSANFYRPRRKP